MPKNLTPLPKNDEDFWDGAEKYVSTPISMPICKTHGKNWMSHDRYIDNGDGTASCLDCSWGFRIPGYLRVLDGKIVDLRKK
jgi:hypothetical protein